MTDQENTQWHYAHPKSSGLMVFGALLLLGAFVTWLSFQNLKRNEEKELNYIMQVVEQNIQQSLNHCYAAALTLALTLDSKGTPQNFDSVAAQVIGKSNFIDALQLVPKGVIQYTYPLEGNEEVIGYDIIEDEKTRKEAEEAVLRREMFFAGPLELKQGGLAVIGRLPLFVDNEFWGFSAVIIKLNTLVETVGLGNGKKVGYHFQFSKRNPNTGETEYFLPLSQGKNISAEETFTFEQGGWELKVTKSWNLGALTGIYFIGLLSFGFAAICGVFVKNILKKPLELQSLVEKQASRLILSEQKTRTLLESIPDLMFVINKEGIFKDYQSSNGSEPMIKPEHFLNKSVFEVLDEELARNTFDHVQKTLAGEQSVVYEYELHLPEGTFNYESRFVKNSEQEVLAIIRDVSQNKKYIQEIEAQNIKLKDIAWMQSHVVRAPLARIMGLISYFEIHTENDTLCKKEILKNIMESANELDNVIREIVHKAEMVENTDSDHNGKEYQKPIPEVQKTERQS